jgi:hypothetical protein
MTEREEYATEMVESSTQIFNYPNFSWLKPDESKYLDTLDY